MRKMRLIKVEKHSKEELFEKLRKVSLMQNPEQLIYQDCTISLVKLHTDFLVPPQAYVLGQEVQKIRELRWALQEHGVDLFELEGYVTIWREDADSEPIDVMPAIIEESFEANGSLQPLICDGMHRMFVARLEGVMPQVAYIRGIPLPYYAYPWPGGWSEVILREDLPSGFIKKWHRIADYKKLYRNFNSAFQNVGGPRGHF